MNRVKKQYSEVMWQIVLKDTDKDRAEAFKERAAIMEFEGGLSRKEAERLAYEIVYGKRRRA